MLENFNMTQGAKKRLPRGLLREDYSPEGDSWAVSGSKPVSFSLSLLNVL